jgi:hypothetical protein
LNAQLTCVTFFHTAAYGIKNLSAWVSYSALIASQAAQPQTENARDPAHAFYLIDHFFDLCFLWRPTARLDGLNGGGHSVVWNNGLDIVASYRRVRSVVCSTPYRSFVPLAARYLSGRSCSSMSA